jgi:hypothetical protein
VIGIPENFDGMESKSEIWEKSTFLVLDIMGSNLNSGLS